MKIEVELVSRQRSDRPSMDIEVVVTTVGNEQEVINHAGIRVANPTNGSSSTRDMLRLLFGTQGDLYRDLGIRNYKTFQPDYNYFSNSSEGWQRFVTRVAAAPEREETLKRFAQLIGSRIRLFTQVFPPAIYEVAMGTEIPPIGISVGDLTPTNMEIRVGPKIFRVTAVEDEHATLIASAITELKMDAASKLTGFQTECSRGLDMMKKQYEHKMEKLEAKYAHIMEAPVMSDEMRLENVLYTTDNMQHTHIFFIPIKMHTKYIQGRNSNVRWKLKPKYQLRQKAWLKIITDAKFNVKSGHFLDMKFKDTVQQWHQSGGGICWGSYAPKMTSPEDLIKLRDEIASIMSTINAVSIGKKNLRGIQDDMYNYMTDHHRRYIEPGLSNEEWDMHEIADRIPYDTTTGVWESGDAWSTK